MESQFDILVIFHTTHVHQDGPGQGVTQAGSVFKIDDDSRSLGRIIEIGWCSFDTRKQSVIDECQIFVKPSNAFILTVEQTTSTGIVQEDLMKGIPLQEAISKFNDHCYYNYTSHNKSFCLATLGESILTKILPSEVRILGIKLPQHFFQFFDILQEFKRFYAHTQGIKNTQGMLGYLQLRDIPIPNQCQLETKNLVRVVNKLVKDKHVFVSPKLLNQRHEIIRAARENSKRNNNTYKRWSGFIRGRSPEALRFVKDYYIRVRGLPSKTDKEQIKAFFKAIRIVDKNMAFLFDSFGRFSGEVVIKLMNEEDFRESLSYHLGSSKKKVIEVYEAREEDFVNAADSSDPQKRTPEMLPMIPEGAKIVSLSGLSKKMHEIDIRGLITNVRLVGEGILRALSKGNLGKEALLLLNDESDLKRLKTLEGQEFMGSTLSVEEKDREYLSNFLKTNFVKRALHLRRQRLPNVPLEKRNRTLVMYDLPFDIMYEDVVNVFRNDKIIDNEIFMVKGDTGVVAMVSFVDEIDARRALKTKNLIYIKNRYIELHEIR